MAETPLITKLNALAGEWMRNEERSADYQDGLADAADQLRAVLADEVPVLDIHAADFTAEARRYAQAVEAWAATRRDHDADHQK